MLTQLRPAKIKFYLKYMARRGFTSEQVLEGTGISEAQLRKPDCLIEISSYIRIIHNINEMSASLDLAFSLADELSLGDLGLLGYCVMTCDDTDEANRLWHQYNPVFFGNLIEMSFINTGKQMLLRYIPYLDIRDDLLQFLIEEKIAYDLALQRLIGLSEFPMASLSLSYAEPEHSEEYRHRIKCPIKFSSKENKMLLKPNALTLPLQGGDSETHRCCLETLKSTYAWINNRSDLTQQIREMLYESAHNPPSIEQIASRLCCSSRTVHRQLQKEGHSFTELSIATRLELTKNLLATTNLDTSELAARVGFGDVRSLRRFFKSHTGKTIREFKSEAGIR